MSPRPALPALLLLAACTEPPSGTLPDWSEGYEDTGEDSMGPIETMGLVLPDDLGRDGRIHLTDSTDACGLSFNGTISGYSEARCTLDVPELDLYAGGLAFDLEVPRGLCEYIVYGFYQYEAWQVGTGPSTVSYTVTANGTIKDEVGTEAGVPVCAYDYSRLDSDWPNCCLGTYVTEVTYEETGLTQTGPVTPWDGTPSECYGGAAFLSELTSFDADGWPMHTIVYLARSDWRQEFVWEPLSSTFHTNVPLANHYDPADHDGGLPAGLAGLWAHPSYDFECYDNAEELLGRIELEVREWNEVDEFDTEGDPDTTGFEPVSGAPIDDRQDWATATPGADTYIESRQ